MIFTLEIINDASFIRNVSTLVLFGQQQKTTGKKNLVLKKIGLWFEQLNIRIALDLE